MRKFLLASLMCCTTCFVSGQVICDKTKLYGRWKYVAKKSNTNKLDLPTLRINAAEGKTLGVYHFRENGTWTYKPSTNELSAKDTLHGRFFFDEATCELKWRKRYPSKRYHPKTLYFSNDTLVITSSNPHWDSINLWVKEK